MSNLVQTQDLSAGSFVESVRNDLAAEESRMRELKAKSDKAEVEKQMLQKIVYDSSNPSPIYVALLVVGMLLILYIVYVMFWKPCMEGKWMDKESHHWYINHNRFTNVIEVVIDNSYAGAGYILDNYVEFGELIGVWNYENKIIFTNGDELNRIM